MERPAQLVHHQGGERLALDVLGHHEQRLSLAGHLLQNRQEVLHARDLLLVQQDQGLLEHRLHAFGIGDEVGREVAAVELHALDQLEGGLHRLGLFDGDHPLLAHLLHGLGEDLTDGFVAVGRDRSHLRDLFRAARGLGLLLQLLHDRVRGLLDPALEIHRVHPRRHHLAPLAEDGVGEHGGGGGAVSGHVGGLAGHFLHQLRTQVFEVVLEVHLLGHGDAVLRHRRRPPALFQEHVAALGAERHAHRVRQRLDAAQQSLPRVVVEANLFGSHGYGLLTRAPRGRRPRE